MCPILSALLPKGWEKTNLCRCIPAADSTKTFIAANETMWI